MKGGNSSAPIAGRVDTYVPHRTRISAARRLRYQRSNKGTPRSELIYKPSQAGVRPGGRRQAQRTGGQAAGGSRSGWIVHRHSKIGTKPLQGLVFDHLGQSRTQRALRQVSEAESAIEGCIPWDVLECSQNDVLQFSFCGALDCGGEQLSAQPSLSVTWQDIDLQNIEFVAEACRR